MTDFAPRRRDLLVSGGAGLLSYLLGRIHPAFARDERPGTTYLLCPEIAGRSSDPGRTSVGVINMATGEYRSIDVPAMGHSLVGHPVERNRVVMLGQRPGPHSVEIDLDAMRVARVIEAGGSRYFYGHGTFDQAGKYLYSTEDDDKSKKGFVAVRDAKTFQLLENFSSYGVGPHELDFFDGGRLTVIGNGGLKSKTKEELAAEIPTMEPSLDVVETATGKLLQTYKLPHKQLSIRHLALGPEGQIALSLKYYGSESSPCAAVALGNIHSGISIPDVPAEHLSKLRESTFGVELSPDGRIAAFTHLRSQVLSLWDVAGGQLLNIIELGITPEDVTRSGDGNQNVFLLNSRYGLLAEIDMTGKRVTRDQIAKVTGLNWKHTSFWTV